MTTDALVRAHAEPTHPIREWTTVFVGAGDDHQVVAEGAKVREWRNINNFVRGPARTAVLGLIRKCIADRELKIEPFEGKVADALGPVGAAHPILTPDKSVVVAVQIWSGDPKKNPPDRPNVGAWEWVLSSEDNPPPPQLQLDPGAIELIGMSVRHQDRSVFGPADLYTRSARLSDTLRHVRQIRDSQVKDRFDGTFTIRAETDVTRELRYAERCVEGPAGRRVRGICWDAGTDEALVHESMLDAWLSTMLASTSGMYIAVGDLSYQYPYWLKWVTEHVPGLGHGVSTGQTFALHEEDWPKIIEWVQQVRKGPVSGTVRARRGGGGWLKAEFRGFLLDPLVSDSIGVAVISPEIETIPDETS